MCVPSGKCACDFFSGHAICRVLLETSGVDLLLQACHCGVLITLMLFRFDGGAHAANHSEK
jgi:hypothetical protein